MHTNSSSQKSPISQVQTSEKSSKTCAAINTNVLHASFHFVIVCACSLGIDIDLTQQIKCVLLLLNSLGFKYQYRTFLLQESVKDLFVPDVI